MNILILGGTGFIGNAIFHRLVPNHDITLGSRKRPDGFQHWVEVDFARSNDWSEILKGIDLVINAIGIIEGDFKRIQTTAPLELYDACIADNISIIHFSAIGAEKETPLTEFLSTKKITDDFLLRSADAKVIYPGVVIGKMGRSSQFFKELSALPVIGLFTQKPMLFVHINQLSGLVEEIVGDFNAFPSQVFAVCQPEPFRDVLDAIKGKPAAYFPIPSFIFGSFFSVFSNASIGILNKDTFRLANALSADDYESRFDKVSTSIDPKTLQSSQVFPRLFALLSVSFLWLWTAFSSIISWDESYALMQEIGANHIISIAGIWAGTLADLFLGLAIFSKKHIKKVIILQMLTMFSYMTILSVFAPHYWIHPFGVLSKNIPLIALSYYLYRRS